MNMESWLRQAVKARALRDIDLHFALYLARLAKSEEESVMLAAALASRRTGEGDVCVALEAAAESLLFASDEFRGIATPPVTRWREALRDSGVVGNPGDYAPLILDGADRLYLGRYWHFENTIVQALRVRTEAPNLPVNVEPARAGLERHFPAKGEIDHQRLAATVALLRPFSVIAGGPGTGKTTTVTRLLALLVEQTWPKVPRIALVAPTGKAAARLSESIKMQKANLACAPEVREAIVEEARTLHRLLKAVPGRAGFRHNARNPVHVDVMVVDEASMVDVPTMARLLDALPATARLILLGDPDQLASVEAGSILGDICNRGAQEDYSPSLRRALQELGMALSPFQGRSPAVADSLVVLEQSRRFGSESGIGRLARAVNEGDGEGALALLNGGVPDLAWHELDEASLPQRIGECAVEAYAGYFRESDPVAALSTFGRFRVLCALREGTFGVTALNQSIEEALRQRGLIGKSEVFYAGRPVMVTRNDYALGLFNGDIGMIWPDGSGRLRAIFTMADGTVKRVLPTRLPDHETAFAMTIHKSQGSEFDHCVVVLPDRDAAVLTRELVYTGITRARKRVELWSPRAILLSAIRKRIERTSGLRDALWGKGPLEERSLPPRVNER